jgi:DNA-binding MarR family transcriptional regulator
VSGHDEQPRRSILRGRRTPNRSTIARLDGRGLVQRTAHPVHRPLIEIRLTRQGSELFERAEKRNR